MKRDPGGSEPLAWSLSPTGGHEIIYTAKVYDDTGLAGERTYYHPLDEDSFSGKP